MISIIEKSPTFFSLCYNKTKIGIRIRRNYERMRIIISPAKTMNVDTDTMPSSSYPQFLEKTRQILSYLQSLTYEEAKQLWKCNDKLAQLNFERIQCMDLDKAYTPAILAYEGIQYQYMAPSVFESEQWAYMEEHLRILSGFYGTLRPCDGVTPYRLEMQAKAQVEGKKDLYEFWGDTLYQNLVSETDCILNLASKEYSKCVEMYVKRDNKKIQFVTCVFAEEVNGKLVQKATMAKMARGQMVRFLAEEKIQNVEDVKKFDRMGYQFLENDSTENLYIFRKESE